ncbi:MAG: tRNA 4-thiouridine(8) synthase ThiI, partial [Thermoplasmatales archaeon]|nr:tRNA 4-thiouridine(8) synthase ThiI [Thermoplasmatales archaeon]
LECVLCKRMMLRIGEKIAKTENADGLVTGESLGQVASQTLENIYVTNNAVKIPVLRPLIGFDKIEIEKIAKETGLYEISIIPCLPCSAVPKKPSTMAKLKNVLNEEERIDISALVEDSVRNAVVIDNK